MNKLLTVLLLTTAFIVTTASAADNNFSTKVELTEGMKVFKKKMRKGCRSTAIRFSRSHTQHQWEVIKKHGMLRRVAKDICPHLDTSLLTDNDWNNIYSFVTEHSSDNPEILKC